MAPRSKAPRRDVAVSPRQISLFEGAADSTDPSTPSGIGARSGLGDPSEDRPVLRLAVLGSGSSGNCVVLECGSRVLMLDAGFSCRETEKRLAGLGVDPGSLGGLVLTHEHRDHCRGAERLVRRHDLPVFATEGTLEGGAAGRMRGRATVVRSGFAFEAAGFWVEPFSIPHDAREPIGVVVEDPFGRRVGLVADLGARSQLAWGRLRDLSLLLLETNHDLEMLRSGPYPWALKQRVAGRHGHLSNREAAEGLEDLAADELRWVVLYHLSRTNNLPALAEATVSETLTRIGCSARVVTSRQQHPTDWIDVEERA